MQLSRTWRRKAVVLIVLIFYLGASCAYKKEMYTMNSLKLYIDSEPVTLAFAPKLKNGEALVPIHTFSQIVGAEVKTLEGSGQPTICKNDLCIPVNISGANAVSIDGVIYVPLSEFASPLGLSWRIDDNALKITSSEVGSAGLGIGDYPPDFTLSDLYTGESVSLKDYRGKKAVFFMWASW